MTPDDLARIETALHRERHLAAITQHETEDGAPVFHAWDAWNDAYALYFLYPAPADLVARHLTYFRRALTEDGGNLEDFPILTGLIVQDVNEALSECSRFTDLPLLIIP